jgi:hypothetical protein
VGEGGYTLLICLEILATQPSPSLNSILGPGDWVQGNGH